MEIQQIQSTDYTWLEDDNKRREVYFREEMSLLNDILQGNIFIQNYVFLDKGYYLEDFVKDLDRLWIGYSFSDLLCVCHGFSDPIGLALTDFYNFLNGMQKEDLLKVLHNPDDYRKKEIHGLFSIISDLDYGSNGKSFLYSLPYFNFILSKQLYAVTSSVENIKLKFRFHGLDYDNATFLELASDSFNLLENIVRRYENEVAREKYNAVDSYDLRGRFSNNTPEEIENRERVLYEFSVESQKRFVNDFNKLYSINYTYKQIDDLYQKFKEMSYEITLMKLIKLFTSIERDLVLIIPKDHLDFLEETLAKYSVEFSYKHSHIGDYFDESIFVSIKRGESLS